MKTVLVTGSAGLVGAEAVYFFAKLGFRAFALTRYGLVGKDEISRYPSADMVFLQADGLNELLEINYRFYAGGRKLKGEIRKILLPIWRKLKI